MAGASRATVRIERRASTCCWAEYLELCSGCHRKPDLLQTAAHQKEPEADCLACHNPHVGKNAFLLKAEHDEWRVYGEGG